MYGPKPTKYVTILTPVIQSLCLTSCLGPVLTNIDDDHLDDDDDGDTEHHRLY